MDGKGDLLTRIRASLAAYDDDALAAIASRGLLRRAQKDLDTIAPVVVGEVDGKLRVKLGDALVELHEAPNQSTCDCPSSGVCRHILAVLLSLRESAGGLAPAASCEGEILCVDEESLQKWAGAALLRRAVQRLAQGIEAISEGQSPVAITIPALNVTCRWMPGGGLAGMVCSCHAATVCEHRVMAVLAYRVSKGLGGFEDMSASLEASTGAPRSRAEILESVKAVVCEMVAQGLSRVSLSTEQRLRTLAVSAHGVDLPRLERLLRSLADEVALQLARDARADVRNLLSAAAISEAICCALDHPTPATVGTHRSRYESVGNIELVGLGARRWRTRSGYAGLTVYFWDKSASNWATWTDARPLSVGAFDGLARYREAGPWEGCVDPSQVSRSRIRLSAAWRSASGRLSGRASTRALVLGVSGVDDVRGIDRWNDLTDRASRLFGGALGERDERDEIVLLCPARWGKPTFDEIRQEMVWPVTDSHGKELMLVLPNTPETADAMRPIERASLSELNSVLGILRLSGGRIVVEPVSLLGSHGQVNLSLDEAPRMPAHASQAQHMQDEPDDPGEENTLPHASGTALGLLLSSAEIELEEIAESGVSVRRDLGSLRSLSGRLDALGMSCCSRPLGRVADLLSKFGIDDANQSRRAESVLRAYYVCRLASAQELIQSMMSG